MPKRFASQEAPCYARLVNFVTERLWDYDSCEEAQLKIWLARHLLATENTGEEAAGGALEFLSRKRRR